VDILGLIREIRRAARRQGQSSGGGGSGGRGPAFGFAAARGRRSQSKDEGGGLSLPPFLAPLKPFFHRICPRSRDNMAWCQFIVAYASGKDVSPPSNPMSDEARMLIGMVARLLPPDRVKRLERILGVDLGATVDLKSLRKRWLRELLALTGMAKAKLERKQAIKRELAMLREIVALARSLPPVERRRFVMELASALDRRPEAVAESLEKLYRMAMGARGAATREDIASLINALAPPKAVKGSVEEQAKKLREASIPGKAGSQGSAGSDEAKGQMGGLGERMGKLLAGLQAGGRPAFNTGKKQG
jgi:hypothetical protein